MEIRDGVKCTHQDEAVATIAGGVAHNLCRVAREIGLSGTNLLVFGGKSGFNLGLFLLGSIGGRIGAMHVGVLIINPRQFEKINLIISYMKYVNRDIYSVLIKNSLKKIDEDLRKSYPDIIGSSVTWFKQNKQHRGMVLGLKRGANKCISVRALDSDRTKSVLRERVMPRLPFLENLEQLANKTLF